MNQFIDLIYDRVHLHYGDVKKTLTIVDSNYMRDMTLTMTYAGVIDDVSSLLDVLINPSKFRLLDGSRELYSSLLSNSVMQSTDISDLDSEFISVTCNGSILSIRVKTWIDNNYLTKIVFEADGIEDYVIDIDKFDRINNNSPELLVLIQNSYSKDGISINIHNLSDSPHNKLKDKVLLDKTFNAIINSNILIDNGDGMIYNNQSESYISEYYDKFINEFDNKLMNDTEALSVIKSVKESDTSYAILVNGKCVGYAK